DIHAPSFPGCRPVPDLTAPFAPFFKSEKATSELRQTYRCGTDVFVLDIVSFPGRIGARDVYRDLQPPPAEASWEMLTTKSLRVQAAGIVQNWFETEFTQNGQHATLAS